MAAILHTIFQCIFMSEKLCVSIQTLLKFVYMGRTDIIPALVSLMAWLRIGDRPLSDPMLTWITDTYMR